MQSKIFFGAGTLILSLIVAGAVFLKGWFGLHDFLQFEKVTLAQVLSDSGLRENYGLEAHSSPESYGFLVYSEVRFRSLDGTELSGWWVPTEADPQAPCIIFAHGMQRNRLAGLPYLQLLQNPVLRERYQVFLPDFRNSGNAASADTYLGFLFAEDLAASMLALERTYGIREFVLYGFEAGAMAAALTLTRKELFLELKAKGISVIGLVLDSPLSHAEEMVYRYADLNYESTRAVALWLLSRKVGALDRLRLGNLQSFPKIPLLITQNLGDEVTPADMLLVEAAKLPHAELLLFDGEGHANAFFEPKYRPRYENSVVNFLKKLPFSTAQ